MTRTIKIVPVLNGYVVHAGCQSVVFDDRAKLLAALSEYLVDAAATEEKFLAGALNRGLVREEPIPTERAQVDSLANVSQTYNPTAVIGGIGR